MTDPFEGVPYPEDEEAPIEWEPEGEWLDNTWEAPDDEEEDD